MSQWPMVPLSEVLELQRRWIKLQPTETYKEIGIRCFGNGIFHKTPVEGSILGSKRVLQIKPGDLVFNNVFAWEGAVAVAGPDEAGMIGSHRFVTYSVNPQRSTPEYLKLFFTTPQGLEILLKASPGSAGRNKTLGLDRFISNSIPLPSIAEQLKLVKRVDALATKIEEAKGLREEIDTSGPKIFASRMNQLWNDTSGWKTKQLGELVATVCGQVNPTVEPYTKLPHINGESMESGTARLLKNYRSAESDGITSGKYHFKPNTILYSKIRPYLRKCVQIPFEGICSADIYAFETISPELEARFLMYSLIGSNFTVYANELSGRTRMPKLNQNQLFAYQLQFPPLEKQRKLVEHLDELQLELPKLQAVQAVVSKELDALFPAILDRAFRGEL